MGCLFVVVVVVVSDYQSKFQKTKLSLSITSKESLKNKLLFHDNGKLCRYREIGLMGDLMLE